MKPPKHTTPNLPAAFESMKTDYAAMRTSRFRRQRTGLALSGSGGDYHYRSEADYLRLMEYARDMDRNDAVIGQMVDRAVMNTVQGGLVPDPKTGDDKIDEDLRQRFDDWASDPEQCDVQGEMTFGQQQEQVLRSMFIDGDIFALPLDSGQLQLVEAHRARTPTNTKRNVIHGVVMDDKRRRLEYWFTKDDIELFQSVARVGDMEQYPAYDGDGRRNVYHVYSPKRSTQTRGVTALAPIFDVSGMFEDIQFAKMVQQQIVSCIAFIRKRDKTYEGHGRDQYGAREEETMTDGVKKLIEELAPGMEIEGEPGETIEGFSPNVPNAEYFQHVRLILTLLGINLGIPLVMLLLDGSETNFSGWRGAIDQARLGFRRNQRLIRDRFCRHVNLWKVRQWISEDRALRHAAERLGPTMFKHEWNFPGWPYVQPKEDAETDAFRIEKRLASPRRVLAERGIEYSSEIREIIEDNALAIRSALTERESIIQDFPDAALDWRELLRVTTPEDLKLRKDPKNESGESLEVASD